jgi:hypothetical protein
MRKIIKKALGPLAIFAMALGVGLSVAKEKTPVGVKAATYTQITNVNQIISGEKYLITSIQKDKTAKIYLPAGAFNSTPAGVEFTDVNLVDSVNAWTINLVDGGYEITDGTNYMYTTGSNTGLRSGTTTNKVWSIFNSTSYPGRLAFKYTGTDRYLTLYLSQDWRSYEVFHDGSQQMSHLIIYQVDSLATPNVMTAIDVTPTTKSYFLVEQGIGSGGTINLPTPDQVETYEMGATGFKVALTNSATAPLNSNDASVIDFLGANANDYEKVSAPAPSNTQSVARILDDNGEPIDTDNNGADFVKSDPTPKNSAISVADYVMAADTEGQCVTKYPIAKARVLGMNSDQITHFKGITNAKLRYEAWAIYHNDLANAYPSGGSPVQNTAEEKNTVAATAAIGLIGLTSMLGYYFIVKRKKMV